MHSTTPPSPDRSQPHTYSGMDESYPDQVLCVHSCGGLDHAAWVVIDQRTILPQHTRLEGRCEGSRPITLIEGPQGDLTPGWTNPCSCLTSDDPNPPHSGHCCQTSRCNHFELVWAAAERLPVGDLPRWAEGEHQW